ncbi:uracil phosphoribosyltransferase [bacterium]|nr:uracil phosphoribosyltransferase [bacterium]
MENLIILNRQNTLLNSYLAELRDVERQKDSHRFRENLEAIGGIMAYEISKSLQYEPQVVPTPLGQAEVNLSNENLVVCAILRAALPLQNGMLRAFRSAEAAFISAFRQHTSATDFEIVSQYEVMPDLTGKTLILADPMCATGSSLLTCYHKIMEHFKPQKVLFASVFSSKYGMETLATQLPQIVHYTCVVDLHLDANSYIVPGLGDAGDLAFGVKV